MKLALFLLAIFAVVGTWDLKSGFDAPQLIAIARAELAKGEK